MNIGQRRGLRCNGRRERQQLKTRFAECLIEDFRIRSAACGGSEADAP
jgi:hypothetical protein